MPKMHYKTPKIKKISLDEKIMSKRAHGMLEIIKIYFPTNFQAYLMNIGWIITKKPNYNNMQMSFWAKISKNPLKSLYLLKIWSSFGTFIQFLKHKVYNSFEHSNEVHVIFYVPSIWGFNLKKNTQSKRDSSKAHIQPLESSITDDTKVPSAFKWPSSLANWEDKQELVMYIGKKLLLAQKWLPLTRWCKACGWWMFSRQWDLHHLKAWY